MPDPRETVETGTRTVSVMYDGEDTHPTLTCNNAGGAQRMPDKENFNGIIEMTEIQEVTGPMEAKDGRGVHSQFAGEGKLIPVELKGTGDAATFTKGAHPMDSGQPQNYEPTDTAKTLNCFNNSEARAEEVIVHNYKSNLAGGDTETAAVTGDHDSRSTDFTNLLASQEPVAGDGHAADVVGDKSPTLTGARVDAMNNPPVSYHYAVRRITPTEGERLQGFSDFWTRPCFRPEDVTDALVDEFVKIHQNWAIINQKSPKSFEEFAEEEGDGSDEADLRKRYAEYLAKASKHPKPKTRDWVRKWLLSVSSEDCPDGPRYKAIGNSMSVNVMQWIGMRIQAQEDADNCIPRTDDFTATEAEDGGTARYAVRFRDGYRPTVADFVKRMSAQPTRLGDGPLRRLSFEVGEREFAKVTDGAIEVTDSETYGRIADRQIPDGCKAWDDRERERWHFEPSDFEKAWWA